MKNIFLLIFCSLAPILMAQNVLYTGKVIDFETDTPLPYVSVAAQDSNSSTVTNVDGKFQIWVKPTTKKLIFSHLNYENQSIALKNNEQKNMVVYMDATVYELDELFIPNRPIKDIIEEVLDNSQKQFSQDVMLSTYYREMLTINNEINTLGDGMLDFYYKDKRESDIVVHQSRFAKFKSDEFKAYEDSVLKLYLLDMQELVTNAFRFTTLRDIIKEKEYSLNLTQKKDANGKVLTTLQFEPVQDAQKVAWHGTMTYDDEKQLVLDIDIKVHPDFAKNLRLQNRILYYFKPNNLVRKTIFNQADGRYYLAYKMGRVHGTIEQNSARFYAGGNYELVVVDTKMNASKVKASEVYHEPTLERLGKNYITPYWQQQNTLVLSEKEKAVLGRLNQVE